jgi:hypothetical protein
MKAICTYLIAVLAAMAIIPGVWFGFNCDLAVG